MSSYYDMLKTGRFRQKSSCSIQKCFVLNTTFKSYYYRTIDNITYNRTIENTTYNRSIDNTSYNRTINNNNLSRSNIISLNNNNLSHKRSHLTNFNRELIVTNKTDTNINKAQRIHNQLFRAGRKSRRITTTLPTEPIIDDIIFPQPSNNPLHNRLYDLDISNAYMGTFNFDIFTINVTIKSLNFRVLAESSIYNGYNFNQLVLYYDDNDTTITYLIIHDTFYYKFMKFNISGILDLENSDISYNILFTHSDEITLYINNVNIPKISFINNQNQINNRLVKEERDLYIILEEDNEHEYGLSRYYNNYPIASVLRNQDKLFKLRIKPGFPLSRYNYQYWLALSKVTLDFSNNAYGGLESIDLFNPRAYNINPNLRAFVDSSNNELVEIGYSTPDKALDGNIYTYYLSENSINNYWECEFYLEDDIINESSSEYIVTITGRDNLNEISLTVHTEITCLDDTIEIIDGSQNNIRIGYARWEREHFTEPELETEKSKYPISYTLSPIRNSYVFTVNRK